ncbi:MAG: hypothetical protein AABZ30_08015, partial [Myxococcota bacterium]
ERVDFPLALGAWASGFVRDAQTREPIARFTVGGGGVRADGRDGAFVLGPLRPGRHAIDVKAKSYDPARIAIDVPAARRPREETVRELLIELRYRPR